MARVCKLLTPILIAVLAVYVVFFGYISWAMHQSPERFGHVMARLPQVAYFLVPFETLWTQARSGHLRVGDAAPDFRLTTLDKSQSIELSALRSQKPVVLVFGSYT
jgi:hypothetical protein